MKESIQKKIYYHDTDCGGVVYYANYLKYLEEARCQYCLDRNVDLKKIQQQGVYFVVARVEIDYKSPAHFQDTLDVFTRIEKIGSCSILFNEMIKGSDSVIALAKTTWVCVNSGLKPQPLPDDIKKALLMPY
jgi:acyl-CoA thioester hydrolase